MKTLSHALLHWVFNVLHDTEAHLERFAGLLTLTRASMLLPYSNPLFPSAVYEFVRLVPQWTWGALALLIALATLYFAGKPHRLLERIWCAYTMGAYWLMLAILFLLGDLKIPHGYFCLAMCLAPLSVIVRCEELRRLTGAVANDKG